MYEPVRLCSRDETHMEHRYWMNFHGDDAYDESFWCPGVSPADDENRRKEHDAAS